MVALSIATSGCADPEQPGQSQVFQGVWLYEYEGSTFIEGATRVPNTRPEEKKTAWLMYEPEKVMSLTELNNDYNQAKNCYETHPFALKFVGRRSVVPYGSGHGGGWASTIIVDRMIMMKRLGASFCYGS